MYNDNNMYDVCKKHMHAYVLAELKDGTKMDGIITGLDDENVYFAVPNDHYGGSMQQQPMRQYGYGSYGYPGYGYGYGYPGPRFRRVILPLAALAAISLLPWY